MRIENLTSEAYSKRRFEAKDCQHFRDKAQVQYSEFICWKIQEVQQKKW